MPRLKAISFVACVGELSLAAAELVYGTYLGGRNKECATGLTVDGAGNAYIVGRTPSQDFPVTNGAAATNTSVNNDDWTGFVSKLDGSGSRLMFSTFVGGNFRSSANAVAVDAEGRVFVVGSTCSAVLPSTAFAVQRTPVGGVSIEGCEGFLIRLNRSGTKVEYGTYLGGSRSDSVTAVALSVDGRTVYVTGFTDSPDFPVTPDAFQPRLSGGRDGFLVVVEPASGLLVYSTYLGGAGDEQITTVKARSNGIVLLGGTTSSNEWLGRELFKGLGGLGARDAFVLRLDTKARGGASGIRIGGRRDDVLSGFDLDASGNVYAAGSTVSSDFPQTGSAHGQSTTLRSSGFVVKLSLRSTQVDWRVRWSRLLGGNGEDAILSISAGMPGFVFVSGRSGSTNFPASRTAVHQRLMANNDTTLLQLRARDGAIVYGTFLGGTRERGASWYNDEATGVVATNGGDVYVTGCTFGGRLPVTANAFQPRPKGNAEPFVVRLRFDTTRSGNR